MSYNRNGSLSTKIATTTVKLVACGTCHCLATMGGNVPYRRSFLALYMCLVSCRFVFFGPLLSCRATERRVGGQDVGVSDVSLNARCFVTNLTRSTVLNLDLSEIEVSTVRASVLP